MNHREMLENRLLLKPAEVAGILECSSKTVYRLIRKGEIDATRSGHARISTASVRRYLCRQFELQDTLNDF